MVLSSENPPLNQLPDIPDDSEFLVSLTSTRPEVSDDQDDGLNIMLIILPVVIVAIIIILGLLFYFKNRKKAP